MAINFPAAPTTNQTYTFNGRTWTWNGVGWQATGSTGLTVYTKTDFTATAGQTSFSCTYTVGFVDVYYNGSKLSTSKYTATTGSTVVLGTACALNDIVETIAWTISSSFNPSLGSASATSLAIGGATIGSNALAVTGTTALGVTTGTTFNSSTLAVPTRQVLTSGTTYTTPANVRQLKIRMVGGGGGGAGGGNAAYAGGNGTATSFNSIVAAFGVGGQNSGAQNSASGNGTGTASFRVPGGVGGPCGTSLLSTLNGIGGMGANSAFGGGAAAGTFAAGGASASTNSGAGGGGGGDSAASSAYSGGGGGAGEYVEIIINAPSTTYTYAIGAGGTGSAAGATGTNGGNGGTGLIIVDEFY